jgi:hypothetical protein
MTPTLMRRAGLAGVSSAAATELKARDAPTVAVWLMKVRRRMGISRIARFSWGLDRAVFK